MSADNAPGDPDPRSSRSFEQVPSYYDDQGRWHSGIAKFDALVYGDRSTKNGCRRPLSPEEMQLLQEMDKVGPAFLSPLEARHWSALRIRAREDQQRREMRQGWLAALAVGAYFAAIIHLQEQFERTGIWGFRLSVILLSGVTVIGMICLFAATFWNQFFRQSSGGDGRHHSSAGSGPIKSPGDASSISSSLLFCIDEPGAELSVRGIEAANGAMRFQVLRKGAIVHDQGVSGFEELDDLTSRVLDEGWRPWEEANAAAALRRRVEFVAPTSAEENFAQPLTCENLKSSAFVQSVASGAKFRILGRIASGRDARRWKVEVHDPGSSLEVQPLDQFSLPEEELLGQIDGQPTYLLHSRTGDELGVKGV